MNVLYSDNGIVGIGITVIMMDANSLQSTSLLCPRLQAIVIGFTLGMMFAATWSVCVGQGFAGGGKLEAAKVVEDAAWPVTGVPSFGECAGVTRGANATTIDLHECPNWTQAAVCVAWAGTVPTSNVVVSVPNLVGAVSMIVSDSWAL
ncbi:hypothetical protein DPSP01_011898 [Paraphaeosphaeria sporulosa]